MVVVPVSDDVAIIVVVAAAVDDDEVADRADLLRRITPPTNMMPLSDDSCFEMDSLPFAAAAAPAAASPSAAVKSPISIDVAASVGPNSANGVLPARMAV